jgi:hypothetical protein
LESAAYSRICEHLQKPHNADSRPQAQFFNTLLMIFVGNVAYAVIVGEDEEAPERQQYGTIGLRRVVRAQRLGICSEKTNPIVWPEHVKVGA